MSLIKTQLQTRFSQQLTLTPQLQQAIRLLQLSTTELQQEIQQAVDTNPLLELVDENNDELKTNQDLLKEAGESSIAEEASDYALMYPDIPEQLPVDTKWEDIYADHSSYKNQASNPDYCIDWYQPNQKPSLQEHLTWQMQLSHFSTVQEAIAITIIDAINDDGLLTQTLDEIHASLLSNGWQLEMPQIEEVLTRIQGFEPTGVAARDLAECLLLQLRQLPLDTPYLIEAINLVEQDLHTLAAHDFQSLQRSHRLTQEQLREVITLIQSLEPRPGSAYTAKQTNYVTPDVFVSKKNGRWVVELNPDILPKIRVNNHYASLVQRGNVQADNSFLRHNLQEARWFLKSLQSRHETLLKVATCIVEHQRNFLEQGEQAMKPLVLRDIADILGMHESTISRVTTQKFMHTPLGIFELKYFFSSHVGSSFSAAGECSSTAIRAHIKKLIGTENPQQPLSDNDIAKLLKQQGIEVARRTIAKYRESMTIAPSHQRKSLF